MLARSVQKEQFAVKHDDDQDDASPPGDNAPRRRTGRRKPVGRAKLKETEKRKAWVRAGGVCVLCKKYLLDGVLTGLEVSLGELAHIVGQKNTPGSPRGLHPMPLPDRDTADNVLVACESCHDEIDDQLVTGILDVGTLNEIKRTHEERIRHVTTLPDDQRTVVLRMIGKLRGNALEVTPATAAETVVADARRFPWFLLSLDRLGVEIDLTALPGEAEADDEYYATARKAIDEVIDIRLHDAIASGAARHVSVFAFARLPLLVYLGSKLDDTYGVDVYQRHRATDGWRWDPDAPTPVFTATATATIDGASEVVLIANVSGVIDETQLPVDLTELPRLVVAPDVAPDVDVMRSKMALDAFTRAMRDVFATLDAHKNIKRLHVFAAAPISATVQLGRVRDPHIHPALVIYDRTNSGDYRRALEIA
ncbi:MAG TPA: SAVED domain-containing protein [Frankiaceae bacterium]|nr:SAVED domain-containing protein [Frankiaceae bacterium]